MLAELLLSAGGTAAPALPEVALAVFSVLVVVRWASDAVKL